MFMTGLLKIFLIFSISFVITFFVLPRLGRVAFRMGLLDYPNRRKVHIHPKPLIGGLGMIMAVSIAGLLFIPLSNLRGVYAGMILLVITGFLDDFKKLNCRWKFMAQILAAIIMIYFSGAILHSFGDLLSLGPISFDKIAIPLTIFCTVGVINAINMIDGLDGLSGGISLIACLSFAVLAYINNQTELLFLSIALTGALIAFLRYNWHPAQIFMGDAGSFTIGFTLVFLSIAITQKDNSLVPPVASLLILAVPIVDTVTIMSKRIIKGKSPFRADKTHFHHILLRFGFKKKNAVGAVLLLSAMLSSFAVAGTILKIPEYYLFSIFLVYLGLYVLSAAYIKDILTARLRLRRRKDKRHYLRIPVTCSYKEKSLAGTVTDLGYSGFSAIFEEALLVGERMETDLFLAGHDKTTEFNAVAEVAWSHKTDNWYKCGFQFIDKDNKQAKTLKSFLEQVSFRDHCIIKQTVDNVNSFMKKEGKI
jgi:UDP-GlcNAc:undecaprenyl-phosphate GlcNAc-1-phosphate transferase